ncbi:MAG: hypothetical protein U0800_17865 [Isosphaeraceae bacterium]
MSHEFANRETLKRVEEWLLRLGFPREDVQVDEGDEPRIAVNTRLADAARVQLIIDAIESADPQGNPSLWDLALKPHPHHEPANTPAPEATRADPIGWHPAPDDASNDPEARKVAEAMERLDPED